ncbi:non-ribosomal peptide synthetase [Kineosporia rhizophila]|uniref:non-ribosomal peptide synthetase n=1 Tax=Kineosporia rhizophila TaxID=84633 RepID=UPI001E2D88FC|nr:non-ribosomal peptide synthetase [Kineosporia rhizophila]
MNTSGLSYGRVMTPIEWLYLGMGSNVIQHVFEGTGELEVASFTEAVAVASQASPGMRLVRKGRRWADSGEPWPVRVLELAEGEELLEHPDLQTTLMEGGPTGEVLLVPGAPFRLVFRAFHGVTDARGLLLWAADIFRVLRGEAPLGARSSLNSDEFLTSVFGADLPPIGKLPDTPRYPTTMAAVPSRSGPRHGLVWRRRSIDGICSAPTARVMAALSALCEPNAPSEFMISVDLRRHRPELRSTAWLSQVLPLTVAPGAGWEEVHSDLLRALAENREVPSRTAATMRLLPLPVVRSLHNTLEAGATKKHRYLATAIVTSLGHVPLEEYTAEGFRATAMYTLGSLVWAAPPSVDVVETAGRTELIVTWRDVPGAGEKLEELLDVLVEALSPAADRQQPANQRTADWPFHPNVVESVRKQALSTPTAVALSEMDGADVTYQELSERADAVATHLQGQGVGQGDVVGVLTERTPAAIAAMLGVLRAGAAYLPLDVQNPDARLRDLLEDTSARICLAQKPFGDRKCFPDDCQMVDLDELPATAVFEDVELRENDLAYVIYTSGSTGKPKGVQIEHGALMNYLHWGLSEFGVTADTRLPLLTSLSFDVTGTSVFLPLISGGTVVLMREQPNHLSLRKLLTTTGSTMLNLTPSHLELIGRLDIAPPGFRSIVVVGEALRLEVAARAQEMFGAECRIINEYGPTEATIGITSHVFDPVLDAERSTVPIGVPAPNTQVHLLDPSGRFVPTGEVGEMYLAGAQLARGYLGRPDLNAERFPTLVDGTRLYRTGDLARWLPSGGLEFLGRIDDQVKIRGHRVEPAEIASVLEEHPQVSRAVVVPRSGPTGKVLYGYVLSDSEVSADELLAFAGERLPAYMVPAAVIQVPAIPYSISGKVDARALPDPLASSVEAPVDRGGDQVELGVASVWSKVLGVEADRIASDADFHHLGGDSVALLNMLAGVCREVLPAAAEDEFMGRLGEIVARPTLANVSDVAREVGALERV